MPKDVNKRRQLTPSVLGGSITYRADQRRDPVPINTHLSLNEDAPLPRAVQAVGLILPTPILGGLHRHYVRI
jgi:hypothetical protein